jgi:alkylation response protein AidB-like acyl-CoA dehydrogenase
MDNGSAPGATGALRAARELAPELFARAARTDAAPLLPVANLDLLATAGLYDVIDLDPVTLAQVAEEIASGCLTTALVWLQHHTALRALTHTGNAALRAGLLRPMRAGTVRAGIALGGLFGARPLLHARPAGDGWALDGESPWVTGWGRVDVLCVAARAGDQVLWALLDVPGPGLLAEPARLVAVDASGTVTLRFTAHQVPAERVLAVTAYADERARDSLWHNGALSLGLTARCCALLGPTPLDAELQAVRAALHAGLRAPGGDAAGVRATAAELAQRAAAALVVATGSGALRVGEHAQRLAREALFLLVFGSRPALRSALLERLGAS